MSSIRNISRLEPLNELTLDVQHLVATFRFKCTSIPSSYSESTELNES